MSTRLTQGRLRQIIKEELSRKLREGDPIKDASDREYADYLQQQHGHFTSPENLPASMRPHRQAASDADRARAAAYNARPYTGMTPDEEDFYARYMREADSGMMNEADDDYYGDDDPFGDDEALASGKTYNPETASYEKPDEVVAAYNKMRRKPMGAIIIDCSQMEGSGGGMYPAYYANGMTVKKFSEDAGAFAFDLLDLMAEHGRLPAGIYIAGPNPDTGVFEINNKY